MASRAGGQAGRRAVGSGRHGGWRQARRRCDVPRRLQPQAEWLRPRSPPCVLAAADDRSMVWVPGGGEPGSPNDPRGRRADQVTTRGDSPSADRIGRHDLPRTRERHAVARIVTDTGGLNMEPSTALPRAFVGIDVAARTLAVVIAQPPQPPAAAQTVANTSGGWRELAQYLAQQGLVPA